MTLFIPAPEEDEHKNLPDHEEPEKQHSPRGISALLKNRGKRFAARFYLHEKMMKNFIKSYVLVFFLPATLIYLAMIHTGYLHIRENNIRTYTSMTAQTGGLLDNKLNEFKDISSNIALDRSFISIASVPQEELDESCAMHMYYLTNRLKAAHKQGSPFSDIILYVPTNGYCITSRNAVPLLSGGEKTENAGTDPANGNALIEMFEELISSTAPVLAKDGSNSVMFCRSLFPISQNNGVVMMPIQKDYLQRLLKLDNPAWTFGGLLGADGDVLYGKGNAPEEIPVFDPDAEQIYRASGESMYFYQKLSSVDAYLVYGILNSALHVNLMQEMHWFIPVFLISIILFAMLTFRCAVQNYNPIKKLCELVEHEDRMNTEQERDVYSELHASLVEAIDAKRSAESSRKTFSEIEYGTRTHAALGTHEADMLVGSLFALKPEDILRHEWQYVKVRLADCFSCLFSAEDDGNSAEFDWMPLFSDCFVEMMKEGCTILPMFSVDALQFLICYEEETDIGRKLRIVQQMIEENYSYETTIAVSLRYQGTTPFADIFRHMTDECRFLLSSKAHFKDERILMFGDFFEGSENSLCEVIMLEHRLNEHLKRGDVANSAFVLEKMLASLKGETADNGQEEEEIPAADVESACSPKEELAGWIRTIIENEYTSTELNVASIADKVNKTPEYVSRCFKAVYEIGLLDYIHKARIRHAKTLMREANNMSIADVAELVGYANVDSYIRVFKKIEGITPGAYRKNLAAKDKPTPS